MKILSLDTSGSVASVAVLDEGTVLGEYSINHKKTHSQKLMPMLKELLRNLELNPVDIDIFAVSTGPGSFTGIRIGIAAVKGMAQSLDKPVVGVSSLEGLAYNVSAFPGQICPIIDARNDNVYTAVYSFNNDSTGIKRITDYMAAHINDVLETLISKDQTIFLGDGVFKFRNIISEKLGNKAVFSASHLLLQKAGSVGLAAYGKVLSGQIDSYINVVPLYLRVSQAERLYKDNCNI